jgi:hypothetical protein
MEHYDEPQILLQAELTEKGEYCRKWATFSSPVFIDDPFLVFATIQKFLRDSGWDKPQRERTESENKNEDVGGEHIFADSVDANLPTESRHTSELDPKLSSINLVDEIAEGTRSKKRKTPDTEVDNSAKHRERVESPMAVDTLTLRSQALSPYRPEQASNEAIQIASASPSEAAAESCSYLLAVPNLESIIALS